MAIIMVVMPQPRTYSRYTTAASQLLGQQIRLGRKRRKWTAHALAERAGISRSTLQKIESGDMGVAIGLVFEVAALVGVRLFDADSTELNRQISHASELLALLPKHTHPERQEVEDDF
ncbi:MAG: helix-turn-helix transcriptional regulator [Thiothrix sp.]|uniref:helix-turn-helix transcriptional regulator n=1 Tax=Thiothrix sp. TaxID=1032 RepID=UPI0026352CD9|nr:helix-turn-helix transcriptional regulator [Thiothrix sp.]MDD5394414.1 helix-turn-helix transcriptional regulator [Thiothrix sp.]